MSFAADFAKEFKAFGGGLTIGSPTGPFGGVSVSTAIYDAVDDNGTMVGGSMGWQFPLGTVTYLCPGAGVAWGSGPGSLSSHSAFFGAQFGFAGQTTSSFRIVPTAGAGLLYAKIDLGGRSVTDTYGAIALGLGFVIDAQMSILPSVEIPLGLERADTSYGIVVAMNFGRRS